jgi:AraC family transcriptional regulator
MIGMDSYGSELRSHTLGEIRVVETLMPGGLVLGDHAHESGQICFVLEGTYSERRRDGEHEMRPGSVLFHDPGERHANSFSRGGALAIVVSFAPDRWRHATRRSQLAEAIQREITHGGSSALDGLALLTLAHLSRPAWFADAIAAVERRYATPAVSLRAIASAVGVHPATLSAAFRRYRKTSVGDSIRDMRMKRAMELLRGDMPLAEIAHACGFSDQAHFTRVFAKVMGTTPGAFRRARTS